MKRTLAACAVGLLAALAPSFAGAQGTFPTRTVRFIVPFPGGGINDVLARIVGEKLQTRWGTADRHREQDRRRRQYRRRARLPVGGRRLHAVAQPAGTARGQPEPVQAALLQAAGIRADHRGRLGTERRDRAQGAAGEFAQGADRLRQGKPGQGDIRQPGERRDPASDRHDVSGHDRYAHGARALPRREFGAQRHDRRSRRCLLRQPRGGRTAVPRRTG